MPPVPAGAPGERGGPPVILYDGTCGLCNRSVQAILRRDRAGRFNFAALQSPWAQARLNAAGLPTDEFDTMVLLADGAVWLRSTAALRVLSGLPGWGWTRLALGIPVRWRDAVYNQIARRRHRWFPAPITCVLPSAAERARFLG